MTLTTGIVIFAPLEVQAVAIPIMRQIAPESPVRLPAHITLMGPFVAHERLDVREYDSARLETPGAGRKQGRRLGPPVCA